MNPLSAVLAKLGVPFVTMGAGAIILQTVVAPGTEATLIKEIANLGATGILMFFSLAFWRKIDQKDTKLEAKDEIIVNFAKSITEALTSNRMAMESVIKATEKMTDTNEETTSRVLTVLGKFEVTLDQMNNVRRLMPGAKNAEC